MINFIPHVYQKSILDIDYQQLKLAGIKCISFDVDETLMALGQIFPSKRIVSFVRSLQLEGFTVVIISNSKSYRIHRVAKRLGVYYIPNAKKPREWSFNSILQRYNITPKQMVHVGNCLVNDVSGGNDAGIMTCLVDGLGFLSKIRDLKSKRRRAWKMVQSENLLQKKRYYQLGGSAS